MKMPNRIGGMLLWLLLAAPAVAQSGDYPNRIVTIVAPSAPGGIYSLFARILGNKFEQRLGKSFVVENRPGASSIVGRCVGRACGAGRLYVNDSERRHDGCQRHPAEASAL